MHMGEQGGLSNDPDKVKSLLVKAAATGDVEGLFELGRWMLLKGNLWGGEPIYKAALQGYSNAQLIVQRGYQHGLAPFVADAAKADFWEHKANHIIISW